jgi:hypothetical protein
MFPGYQMDLNCPVFIIMKSTSVMFRLIKLVIKFPKGWKGNDYVLMGTEI